MSSVIQRQNIKLADLVLMAIADLNSMKLLASPSTIQQHLESKEWFLKNRDPKAATAPPDWAHRSLLKLFHCAYGPVFADWLGHVMRLT